jgi:hypothetical protein
LKRGAGPEYRGVALHSGQSEARLDLVRREIDEVVDISDLEELAAWARSVRNSPESRILAGQKILAALGGTTEQRQRLPPGLTVARVKAMIAGLSEGSGWLNPHWFCSDLEDETEAVKRETPLRTYGPGGCFEVRPHGHYCVGYVGPVQSRPVQVSATQVGPAEVGVAQRGQLPMCRNSLQSAEQGKFANALISLGL